MGHSVIGIEIGYFIRDIVVKLTTSGRRGTRTHDLCRVKAAL